jgi:hypothetical protein
MDKHVSNRPGLIWLILGLVLLVCAYGLHLAETRTSPAIVAMREHGLVTAATVVAKREVQHQPTSTRDSRYTAYLLDYVYDAKPETALARYIANGQKLDPPTRPHVEMSGSINVLRPQYERAKAGDRLVMVVDPARPEEPSRIEAVLDHEVGRYRNLAVFLLTLALFPLGLAWRARRKARSV